MRKKVKTRANFQATRETIFTLHRYFLCANGLRVKFEESFQDVKKPIDKAYLADDGFRFMLMWYAMLYVLIEGWRKLQLADGAVTPLLRQRKCVDLLRECRHSVFHFSPDYFDDRFVALVGAGPEIVTWIRDLNSAFGAYFLKFFADEKTKGKSQ